MLHQRFFFNVRKPLLLLAAALLFSVLAAYAAAETDGLAFRQIAVPAKGAVPVYRAANTKSGEIARLEADAQCEIVGAADTYYRVRIGDQTGYALKSKLKAQFVRARLPEALCDSLAPVNPAPTRHDKQLTFQGELTSGEPLETLLVCVWDERQQKLEHTYMKVLDTPVQRIDAAILQKALPLSKFSGGRKTLVIEGCTASDTVVLYRAPLYLYGELQEPVHVTRKCGGIPAELKDEKIGTAWSPTKKQPFLTVQIPAEAHAALMTLEWKELPESFTVELSDEQGNLLSRTEKQDAFYVESIPIPEKARQAVIECAGKRGALGNLRVYGENYPAHDVQDWMPLPEKIDILLISTHQDDEFLFFGGSIPYYAAREDVTLGVLYMADCGRARYREALNGLWSAGLRSAPIFLGLQDGYTPSIDKARAMWRDSDPERLLVRVIRQYKPEVILCQDLNGEYGHGQHKYTAQLATECFPLAADPDYDPESAEQWGVWQIKKLYVHLYEQNQIRMDWNVPMDDTGIITPAFLAWEGYDKHKSQLSSFSMERDGAQYDNTLFGLYWSSVGPDIEKNDFMENVR